jgi:hypothetical protein
MNTSYFALSGQLNNSVAICLIPPKWLPNIRVYNKLAPTEDLLFKYKNKYIDKEEYELIYINEILNFLDPVEVHAELGSDAILCCWEKPKEDFFCHRTIVADWLMKELGIIIEEL